MDQDNIKTKIDFIMEGHSRPFATTEDYETLKEILGINEDSEYETNITEIKVEENIYQISEIRLSILPETSDLHMQKGINMALTGEPMPYNFRVSVFLKGNTS